MTTVSPARTSNRLEERCKKSCRHVFLELQNALSFGLLAGCASANSTNKFSSAAPSCAETC